jgi:hypothetical protein
MEDDDPATTGTQPLQRRCVNKKARRHVRREHAFGAEQSTSAEQQMNWTWRCPGGYVDHIAYVVFDDERHAHMVVVSRPISGKLEMTVVDGHDPIKPRWVERTGRYASTDRSHIDVFANEGGEHVGGQALAEGVFGEDLVGVDTDRLADGAAHRRFSRIRPATAINAASARPWSFARAKSSALPGHR